jgi:hypothetical protein
VNVRPGMVRVPVRGVVAWFDATEKTTWPLPVPLGPDVMMIHDSWLTIVQPHPAGAPTATAAPWTPPAGTDRPVALSEYVQPAWVTVKVRPAMVSVPVRALVLATFEATEKAT